MACLTLSLVACGSAQDASKGNFGKAIQTYLDKQHGPVSYTHLTLPTILLV